MIGKAGFPARRITSIEVDYLVVAGGGGGGAEGGLLPGSGGGGGAGGILTGTTTLARGVATTVTVGEGGTPLSAVTIDGDNSVFGNIEAVGGGGGGTQDENGRSGGSGGGGGIASSGTTSGGAGTSGQGSAGSGGTTGDAGAGGGAGTSSSITGTATTYATGGLVGGNDTPPANSGNGGRGGTVAAGTGIVVSGAGTAAANGTYQPDGEYNGRTLYRLGSTDYAIRWDTSVGNNWSIDFAEAGMYTAGGGATPGGSSSAIDGAAPAPSIAAEEINTPPLEGADGVVVIAFPDTLPALTVGNGLTFTQPTRAGYRVYRFTAGTGTITAP